MQNDCFNYKLSDDTVIFTDTLYRGSPCIYTIPRNHESFFLVTKGTLFYEKDGVREYITKGQVGYVARGNIDISGAYCCDAVSYIATNFQFDNLNSQPYSTLPFKVLCSQGVVYPYEKLFSDALSHYLSKMPGYKAICNGILLQIIGYLYNELKITDENFKKSKKIENAIIYLKNNYDNPSFKISHIADLCNMSEKHFRRLFFEVYKKTPFDFLQKFRINKAEILLLNTAKSITSIATQCGFSDVYSFSHCFKAHLGISPNTYRKNSF